MMQNGVDENSKALLATLFKQFFKTFIEYTYIYDKYRTIYMYIYIILCFSIFFLYMYILETFEKMKNCLNRVARRAF